MGFLFSLHFWWGLCLRIGLGRRLWQHIIYQTTFSTQDLLNVRASQALDQEAGLGSGSSATATPAVPSTPRSTVPGQNVLLVLEDLEPTWNAIER